MLTLDGLAHRMVFLGVRLADLVHLLCAVCDRDVDRSWDVRGPIWGLGYLSYVHLVIVVRLL